MVNSILQYIEPQLKAYMQFLNRVDSPVFRISNGEMIKGNGQEKEVVTISDLNGNSLYIRQTQPETINERKALSSCDKEYNISARCKVVFYSFGGNDFTINPDKVKSKIVNTLARLDFSHYAGSSTEIKIDVNGTSLDMEKIYTEETGKQFEGNVWPTLVTVDFTLSYVDTNCNTCDIDDNETVITWTPDLTPENCETKAICEVVAACNVIKSLQTQANSLQEQINNLPAGFSCEDLPACQEIIDIIQSIDDLGTSLVTQINNLETTVENYIIYNNESIAAIIQSISDVNTALQDSISTLNTQLLGYIESNDQAITEINNLILSLAQTTQDLDSAIQAVASDLTLKEDIANKVTNFNTPDNVTYPTTQATIDLVDNRVQSNIKIIGDWDASSGSYPLADESNTTPFIAQWGTIIKAGWAFRVGYGQQGTVDGLDYENGDVVYALIDSPSNVSVDWGDLDHNLQQANESLRGTAKIITAAIIEDETTLDDERIVTGKKLWANFWNRVLDLAHTWAAKQTFTTAPRFNSATASRLMATDASKNLQSLDTATYPSLTELSYVKGVTSSIQGQLNEIRSGRKYFAYNNTTYSYTGTTANTILRTIYIPANSMNINSTLELHAILGKSGTAGTMNYAAYITTNPTVITGGSIVKINSFASNNLQGGFVLRLTNKNALNSQAVQLANPGANQYDSWQLANFARTLLSINFAVDQYIHIYSTLANSSDTAIIYDYQCYIDNA